MMKYALVAGVALVFSTSAFADPSSGYKDQQRSEAEMPHCSRPLGAMAIVPPDQEWWREYNLGTPEAIIKVFVQESGCFTLVNRDRAMQSRNMERALADSGELQAGSHMGKGQVKAADFLLQPDIVRPTRIRAAVAPAPRSAASSATSGALPARSARWRAASTSRRAKRR
jgi:hypothetical protein